MFETVPIGLIVTLILMIVMIIVTNILIKNAIGKIISLFLFLVGATIMVILWAIGK